MKPTFRLMPRLTGPFTLNGHVAIREKRLAAAKGKADVVSKVDGWVILRTGAQPIRLSSAVDPSENPRAYDEARYVSRPEVATSESARRTREALAIIDRLEADGKVQLIARIATWALSALSRKAWSANGEAVWEFAYVTVSAAEVLGQMAQTRPKALIPIAKQCLRWPLMMSQNPRLCDKKEILRVIKLGSALVVSSDRFSKWKADVATDVAFGLLDYLQGAWEVNHRCISDTRTYKPIRDLLPPFSKDSAPEWWAFAKQELLRSYPEPHSLPELSGFCAYPVPSEGSSGEDQS